MNKCKEIQMVKTAETKSRTNVTFHKCRLYQVSEVGTNRTHSISGQAFLLLFKKKACKIRFTLWLLHIRCDCS